MGVLLQATSGHSCNTGKRQSKIADTPEYKELHIQEYMLKHATASLCDN